MNATVTIGAQGRVVLPREVRERLGLAAGQRLSVSVRGRALVLERPEDAVAELQALGRDLGAGRSLVDELLAERRAAADGE